MFKTTGILLKGVTFNNPALPKLIDYKALIANNPACVAAFRFDDPDLLVKNAQGGIVRLNSWGGKTPYLNLADGTAYATTEASMETGADVGRFTGPVQYLLQGYSWMPAAGYTIVAIVKPDGYTAEGFVAGNWSSSVSLRAVASTRPVNGVPKHAHYHGNAAPVCDINPGVFNAVIASYDPATLMTKLQELKGPSGFSSKPEVITTAVPFSISHISLPIVGQLDFVALFSKDVTLDADLLANINALAKMRLSSL